MSKRKHILTEDTLKIPRTDFPSISSKQPSPLLLFQLPPQLTLDDLSSDDTNIFIQDDNNCRLISEKDNGYTFDLVKVETSNSYVLVPENQNEARLLREKNTFFLECCPVQLDIDKGVRAVLRGHVYPDDKNGMTISDLSYKLSCSKKQIQDSINRINALPMPNNVGAYGLLSEELERNVWFLITSVLAEWEGGKDYAVKGIDAEEMVEQVLMRSSHEDGFEKSIVHYCIRSCSKGIDGDRTILSVDEISRHVAHYLLSQLSRPIPTHDFLQQWQNRIPGVGKDYEVNADNLKDIALIVHNDELDPMDIAEGVNTYYKYFPRSLLPTEADARFKVLFHQRKKWLADDIEPFVMDLYGTSKQFKTLQELLVAYARIAPKGEGDIDSIWYIAH